MTDFQIDFMRIFENQIYGPRNGFEPRDWQVDCHEAYKELVDRHRSHHEGNGHVVPQHRFTIYAGTASGKTKAVALIVAWMLNLKLVDQVIIVCPNRSIRRKTKKDFLSHFDIDLVTLSMRKHKDGIQPKFQGGILCYGTVARNATAIRQICSYRKTLVIFDEVHHLGDEQKWGDSAVEAFGEVSHVINLTGTPYRSDNTRIPFVTYEETMLGNVLKFKADTESGTGFTYSLGRAVAEGICRKPHFMWHGGTVEIRPRPDGPTVVTTFDDTLKEFERGLRLRGAVTYGTATRLQMLDEALALCRNEGRKVCIFLGGDTQADEKPSFDAREYLPQELAKLGIGPDEWAVVTSDDPTSQDTIENFSTSGKWILISINMISEGTDIPVISACIFLTNITAFCTTTQRIGRSLRLMGDGDPHKTALIFMFRDPEFVRLAAEIEKEIEMEQEIHGPKRHGEGGGSGEGRIESRAEARGVAGGHIQSTTLGVNEYPIEEVYRWQKWLKDRGYPATLLDTVIKLEIQKEASSVRNA